MLGEYVPTDETLKRLKADGYPDRDISITLSPVGKLSFRNLPDCWLTDFGEPHGKFDSGFGSWKLTKEHSYWAVSFLIDGFTSDSAFSARQNGGFNYGDCAMVISNGPPHGLAIAVAAGDSGYLEFRRR